MMTLPLFVLAILSAGGVFIKLLDWLAPMYPGLEVENSSLAMISLSAGVIGIVIAAALYWLKPALAASMRNAFSPLATILENKYYVDEIYGALIVKPLEFVSRLVLWKGVDNVLLDGTVDGGARRIRGAGAILRQMQSGSIRNYATWVVAGSLAILVLLGLAGGIR